jgi:hypothetical protein
MCNKRKEMYKLTDDQEQWAEKRKQNLSPDILRELIKRQKGKCKLTNTEMLFNKANHGTAGNGIGVHPLYATVDHIDPKNKGKMNLNIEDVQLLCYAINDMKGHMPFRLFNVILKEQKEWNKFKTKWQKITKRNEYYELIKKGT